MRAIDDTPAQTENKPQQVDAGAALQLDAMKVQVRELEVWESGV